MQYAFYFDQSKCMSCNTCTVACKDYNQVNPGPVRWRKQQTFEESIGSRFLNLSMSCNHCEKPECVTVCPMFAYTKTAMGPVIHNYEACIGCSKCVAACPYSAPVFDLQANKASKCDMCYDRMQDGLDPYCAQCCPNNALKVDTYENLVARYGEAQDLSALSAGTTLNSLIPSGDLTNPSIVIKHWS